MGKRKQRRRNQQTASKRPKLPKYWVEDFPELSLEKSDISLYITRVNLSDAHHPSLQNVVIDAADVKQLKEESTVTAMEEQSVVKDTADAVALESIDSTLETEKLQIAEIQQCTTSQDYSSNETVDYNLNATSYQNQNQSGESSTDVNDSSSLSNASVSVHRARYPPLVFKRDPKFRHKQNGDCGDGIINPYPKTQVPDKYWAQRKRLFSRYAEGIQLDQESWYSVTPEVIANHIAQRVVAASSKKEGLVVLEAFCGAGGNAIAFARRPEVGKVLCVDTNLSRLEMAAHNCGVYDIPKDKVVFVHADACHVLRALASDTTVAEDESKASPIILSGYDCGTIALLPPRVDAIFYSPPWGGTEYINLGPRQYNLSHIQLNGGVDGEELLRLASNAFRNGQEKNITMFLPRNLNGLSFAQSAFQCGLRGRIELEMDLIDSKFKALTAYLVERSEQVI